MEARTSHGAAARESPRNLYFAARDWAACQPSYVEKDLAPIRNHRHGLVGDVRHKAENLLKALRSLTDFDATGNAAGTLRHLEALRDELHKLTTTLVSDVEEAEARYESATGSPDDGAVAAQEKPVAAVRALEGPVLHLHVAKVSPADVAASVARAVRFGPSR